MSAPVWRVVITPSARKQIETVAAWWSQNRTAAPDRFLAELQRALERLTALPGAGAVYQHSALPGLRRMLLRVSRYHVYYEGDEASLTLTIHAVWHAARGSGPDLR